MGKELVTGAELAVSDYGHVTSPLAVADVVFPVLHGPVVNRRKMFLDFGIGQCSFEMASLLLDQFRGSNHGFHLY